MEPEPAQAAMEQIRVATAAFNDGDFERAFAGMAADVEWHFGPWLFDSQVLVGRDEVISYYRRLREEAGRWEVAQELVDVWDGALVLHQRGRYVGRTSGIGGEQESYFLADLGSDGLVVRMREYETLEEAVRAAGRAP